MSRYYHTRVYPKVLIPKMAVRITDTRQKRKSTRTYECDGSMEAPDPGAHFGPGERPGGASPKKLLRKESKLLKQQGDNTDKNSRPPDRASTRSPEKLTWKVQHAINFQVCHNFENGGGSTK
jgi:hypothetical protein